MTAETFFKGIEGKRGKLRDDERSELARYFGRSAVTGDGVDAYAISDLFKLYVLKVTDAGTRPGPTTKIVVDVRDVSPPMRIEFTAVGFGPLALLDGCFETKQCLFANWIFLNKGHVLGFTFYWQAEGGSWKRSTSVSSHSVYECEIDRSGQEDRASNAASALARYLREVTPP